LKEKKEPNAQEKPKKETDEEKKARVKVIIFIEFPNTFQATREKLREGQLEKQKSNNLPTEELVQIKIGSSAELLPQQVS
jgi:hypothetical protein